MSKNYLTVKEVAQLFNVTTKTIRTWTDKGKLPYRRHKLNNYRIFKYSEIIPILKDINS